MQPKRQNTINKIVAVCHEVNSMIREEYNGKQKYTTDYIFEKVGEKFLIEASTVRGYWYSHRHLANLN